MAAPPHPTPPEPVEPLDAGDDDAFPPYELVELHQVLAWQQAVAEQEGRSDG